MTQIPPFGVSGSKRGQPLNLYLPPSGAPPPPPPPPPHTWHNRLLNVVGIRIWSVLVAKSGRADILEWLFWTGIFQILAKTMHVSTMITGQTCTTEQSSSCHTFGTKFSNFFFFVREIFETWAAQSTAMLHPWIDLRWPKTRGFETSRSTWTC